MSYCRGATPAEAEGKRTVDISITNNTDSSLPHIEIRGVIPEGATLLKVSPEQFQIVGDQVGWFKQETLGQDEILTGFQYKFCGRTGNPIAVVDFIGQSRGSASTGSEFLLAGQ